jgi:hypothetical protein
MDDETAKKSLSTFTYKQVFTKEFCKSKKLKHLTLDDGTINVWPCGQLMEGNKLVTIQVGNRCSCYQQMVFDHQCCHEMRSEGGFNIERFGRRWLNEKTFQHCNPTFWLKDHLRACSTRDDAEADSLEGSDFNQEFDPHSDKEADADLNEKENCAAILELASNLDADSDSDSDNELDSQPLSRLSY